MRKKIDLYVFRHGETDWNAQKKFQGHTDIPLNQKGKDQAQELFQKFQFLKPEICLSSDLRRAVETAKIGLAGHSLTYLFSEKLRETHLGDVEGLSQQDIIDKFGSEILDQWRSVEGKDLSMSFPNGETKQEHLIRIQTHLKDFIKGNGQYHKIAVSTHGGSVVRLVHSCVNAPKESITIPNCCLYHVEYHLPEDVFFLAGKL